MVKRQNLDALADTIDEYDAESREYFQALKFSEIQIGKINTMKATPGWKVLEKKIREELIDRINILTKDDAEVKVLLSLLIVADTKTQAEALRQEITEILPP
jgi:hypothetical protein